MEDGKNSGRKDEELVDEKKYFQKVLDDIVSLNSLFTVAVFIGLSFAQPGQVQSLADDPRCHPGANLRKRLVAFEIASFSSFIFAGFLAKSVKVFLYISKKRDALERENNNNSLEGKDNPHRRLMSVIGFYLSIYGTMVGCSLLLLAMVDVVQIKLGLLSCRSKFTVATVCAMVGVIGLGLLTFFFTVTHGLLIAAIKVKPQQNNGPAPKEAEKV
ncbi:uncharacterized protein LOC104443106 [Eucalyptus grandis]|uniref:uncharacterized protein LOC104443106 n=1 Tax=Eucalyptus grandis TaxID=71139 RepID=UPI00192E7D2F|nr:uncharacterized protein LOC104443106 [Eucalyptus grandis]